MKSTIIVALMGVASAMRLREMSACDASAVSGVVCLPKDVQYWATGMNGDEDLG
jgi:hypothetical protein